MRLSIVIPAHNEEGCVRPTVDRLHATLTDAGISFEILLVNDHSEDGTERVLAELSRELSDVRYVNNEKPKGFGYTIQTGLERFTGDAICIVMADASDDPSDVVAYFRKLEDGFECVFGSRFTRQSRVVDYPRHKLVVNRLANWFINVLFHLGFNDSTNAFKAYRREVIQGVMPILSSHFNITVELPLKAITRGYTYATVPINWYNRTTGVSKLRIKEMGSRYLFIVLYVWLERMLSRGDYQRQHEVLAVPAPLPAYALAATGAASGSIGSARAVAVAPSSSDRPLPAAPASGESAEPDTSRPTAPPAQPSRQPWSLMRWGVFVVPISLLGFILWAIWNRTGQAPYWDEWETVVLVQHVTQGTATIHDFLQFHGEHRIIIPRLVDVAMILSTHWNRQIEMTLDLVLAVGEVGLLLAAMRCTLRATNLLLVLVVPLSLLLFSFAQYANWLAPFQIAFITTPLGVALSVWALSADQITWRWLGVGFLGAVIAALSSLGGILALIAFFPVVLLRANYCKALAWGVCAWLILVPYVRGFPHGVTRTSVGETLRFDLIYLGAPLGDPHESRALQAGAASIALLLVNLVFYWYRHRNIRGLEAWLGMGLFVLGVATLTSLGRSDAMASRYQAFSALWWVVLIALIAVNLKEALATFSAVARAREAFAQRALAGINLTALLVVTLLLGRVIAISVQPLEMYQSAELQNQQCVINHGYATPACLQTFYPNAGAVQVRSAFLEQAHLGLFYGDISHLRWQAPRFAPTRPLSPYYNFHTHVWWTTVSYSPDLRDGFLAYQALGYLYDQPQPDTQALHDCLAADGRHFLSTQADCGGRLVLDVQGWLYSAPPTGIPTAALYSCFSSDNGYFGSTDVSCGGQKLEGLLGYILTQR
jgi:dolichol-phosphate mannosyltransferase